jgi:RNA methyltransferase, TrmH family
VTAPVLIESKSNPLLMAVRKLLADPGGYRKAGRAWIEGNHLVAAAAQRGWVIEQMLVSASAWAAGRFHDLAPAAQRVVRVDDRLLAGLGTLDSAAPVGALLQLPPVAAITPGEPAVVLDRLQDAGNVGSILRSAAALGWPQVLALKGTAALWSPKVLRAGMGAHFGLRLIEGLEIDALDALVLPLVMTTSHGGEPITAGRWPQPCGWVFGHEGQGVSAALRLRCAASVCVPLPGGSESLNVAAAAAICLYEDLRRRSR